jgi:hypothetical protein
MTKFQLFVLRWLLSKVMNYHLGQFFRVVQEEARKFYHEETERSVDAILDSASGYSEQRVARAYTDLHNFKAQIWVELGGNPKLASSVSQNDVIELAHGSFVLANDAIADEESREIKGGG